MKAAFYNETGPAKKVLEIGELSNPKAGPGEVRVRLEFSGVNPTDWKSRSGAGAPMKFAYQIPGQDGAGVIDQTGEGVDGSRSGERVWVFHAAWQRQNGTSAQYTVIPSSQAVPLPDQIDMAQGAGLGIPFIAAHGCLCGDGSIEGKTILIAGGAGAVGNAAIQIAKHSGALVITTVSNDDKAELAHAAGADEIVNYRTSDATQAIRSLAPNGIDRIVEVALTTNLGLDLAVLAPGGSIVTYSAEGDNPVIPVGTMMGRHTRLAFFLVYTMTPDAIASATSFITSALGDDLLKPLPQTTFSLDDVAKAHEAVENNTVGKVLIRTD